MNTAALSSREAFAPREPGGRARGIGLSVLVHAGLVVAIAFGVSWRSRTPEANEAELWAAVPQAAAARAVAPEPTPAPVVPKVAAPPVPAPTPAPPPPKALPDPQIAIEQERLEKLRQQQKAAEEAKKRQAEEERLAKEREKQRAGEEKAKAEKLRQQQEAAEAARKKKLEEEQAAKLAEIARKDQLARIQGLAGATGSPNASGTALRAAGPSAGYAGRIKARIRPNIVFLDKVSGDPTAEVEVRAAADGTIVGRKLLKSSGVPAYDEAVLRAIDKTEVLPRDVDGRVPSALLLVFRANE